MKNRHRPWKEIADEISRVARDANTQRIIELTDELNAAIEEQGVTESEAIWNDRK